MHHSGQFSVVKMKNLTTLTSRRIQIADEKKESGGGVVGLGHPRASGGADMTLDDLVRLLSRRRRSDEIGR